MRRSDFKFFCKNDFLDEVLHQSILNPKNQVIQNGLLIDEFGTVTETPEDLIVKNRYRDNSILKESVSVPLKQIISLFEDVLIEHGLTNPVVYNSLTYINPNPNPDTLGYGWHKDYNPLSETINDPAKLWYTFLFLSTESVNSEFMVSPTADGPKLWNIGTISKLHSNLAIGHNHNMGHEYITRDKNNITLIGMRWYDPS